MSWSYNPKGAWTAKHQMSINGKWDDITRADFLTLAKNVNIKQADAIIEQVKDGVSKWRTFATQYSIPYEMVKAIDSTLLLGL
jgi:serine/threonine-protein kinase HipA